MDDDRYLTGGGEIIPEQRSASYSTNTSIGPFSGGAILAGQEDATPIVGGRFTTQFPEGLSATLSRTGQAGAPMEYARDAIRLAKQLEAGQLALEASRVGSQGLPSYGLQYSGQIGKQGGAPSYYPQPKGHWFVEAGGTPQTPERHVRGGARFNFADGGTVEDALHAVRHHLAGGGFLSDLFSGPDYLSTGEAASPTNWGDPELASDFFKADKALRLAREVQGKADDVTGSIPARAPLTAPRPGKVEERELPAPPVNIPFAAPERGVSMLSSDISPESVTSLPLAYAPTPVAAPAAAAIDQATGKLTARIPDEPHGTALTKQQADYITRTIAAETSGKSPEETQAIASVILNRINSGKYGSSPEAVLFAKRQFEPWMKPAGANYPMKISPTSRRYLDAQAALEAALAGEDITRGATNFWGPKSQYLLGRDTPDWALEMPDYTDIGATRFHRPNKRAEGGEVEGYGDGGVIKKALNILTKPASEMKIIKQPPRPAEYIEPNSFMHSYVEPSSGGYMNVVTRPTGPRGASVIDLYVPEEFRGQGVGKFLQSQVMEDFPSLAGQVSSKAAATNAYNAGRRMAGNEGASLDDIFRAIDENSSVNMWTEKAHGGSVDDALRVVREHHADGEAVGLTAQQRLRETIASIDPERAKDQPVMDPATMGEAWDRARRNYQNFPVQEGEAVARPLELGARDVIGGAIAGGAREPGAQFRRGVADLLVGSTGLPESGTLGVGVADLPMITGIPLTVADMARDIGQGDYASTAMGAALPAAFYARGPLGAAGRRAVEIAREYAKPAAAAATGVAGATVAPDEAEAANVLKALKIAKVAVPDFVPRKMTLQEIRRTFDPHAGAGMKGEELERLIDAYGKVATPASLDPELARRGEEIAKGYITKTGSEYGGRSFFGHKPSVPLEDLGRVTANFANSADLQPIVPKSWVQVGRERPDSPMISLGGDLSDLTTLRGYGPKDDMSALATPRNIHAGFKYMRNPNPYIGWANAEEHAAILDKQVKNLQEINRAVKKDLPIMGVSTAMGPQSIDSSRDMIGVLTSAIEGRGINRKDLDQATNYIRSGAFAEGAKGKADAAALMKDFPGFHDELGAYQFLTSPNIPGTVRGAIIKGLEKKTLVDKGFPEIGQLRYAASDPQFAMAPGNMIGGRMIEIDPALFGRAQANRYFNHFTYPGDTYATYYADVPMVHRNYAAPEATDMLMAKYNQWRKGAKKSDPLKPPITVHPFSTDKTGRDTWRKMFEEQRMVQPINERMMESIQRGEQRRPMYGFNEGGSVEDRALMLVSRQA